MKRSNKQIGAKATTIDLFCGVGGLTNGLLRAGLNVVAGYDIDEDCRFAYERNNEPAAFIKKDIADITGEELDSLFPKNTFKVLVGCAPCQPFSRYNVGSNTKTDKKWGMLYHFARLIRECRPDIVSMENVPDLIRHQVYTDFMNSLIESGYSVSSSIVYCPDYGIPQHRKRLVIFASKHGDISILPPTHTKSGYPSVASAIQNLPELKAGEIDSSDPLHRSSSLSKTNLQRIMHSKPGGSWRDWPDDLVAKCHRKKKGNTYPSVYGRMEWDKPSPTITTQFFGYGNGRFGHPEQNRALSLREGAIIQTFPRKYQFMETGKDYCFKTIGRMIGNAVPVQLGEVIGDTIKQYLEN